MTLVASIFGVGGKLLSQFDEIFILVEPFVIRGEFFDYLLLLVLETFHHDNILIALSSDFTKYSASSIVL
jgi:hypothetical protein